MTRIEREKLLEIHRALDEASGDSEPQDDITDEEMREQDPLFWAVVELGKLLF